MTSGTRPSASHSGEHGPVPPDWLCGTCGEEWPCATKRRRLLEEYRVDPAMLSVYLGSCLAAATQDLQVQPGTSLQDRFIGWLPRGRAAS